MLRLKVLGGISVERDDQPLSSNGPRPRLLALLALVAGHGSGISRDKLSAYLWPESDTPRARNSLKQGLCSIRQSFGIPLAKSVGGLIRLDPALIEVDLWQFDAALARGDEAAAVAVYRGPFLDGFYVSGLDELERWIQSERERLARRYADGLQALAQRAECDRDPLAASIWWRRLTVVEPLCSTAALGYMRALAAAGDPTGAREHARAHATYVRAELGGPVAESVVAFANQLRRDSGESLVAEPSACAPAVPVVTPVGRPVIAVPNLRRQLPGAAAVLSHRVLALPAVPRQVWWAVATCLTVALLLVTSASGGRRPAATPLLESSLTTVAIMPFTATGGAEVAELGRGLEELLAARLDGADGLRTVSTGSAAARASRLYLRGHLISGGAHLRATATLYDRGNTNMAVAWAEAQTDGNDLFDLADALATQLIAEQYQGADERLTKVAATSTRSLPALKSYLSGERRLQAGSYPAAVDAFRQAVAADSTFALAYYRLSIAADWSGRRRTALSAAELAARYSDRLSNHDRRLVEAYLVQRRGRMDEAERLYRAIVADYPEDAEAWLQLAEVLFRANPLRGRSAEEAEPALQRVLSLDPHNKEALIHLARIAAMRGNGSAVDSLIRQTRSVTPDSAVLGLRAFRAFALGDRPGWNDAARELMAYPGLIPATAALQAAVYVDDLTGSERFAEMLTGGNLSCVLQSLGRRMLAQAQLSRGHPSAAMARLASAGPCDAGASLELRAVYASHPFVQTSRRRLRHLLMALRTWQPAAAADGEYEDSTDNIPAQLRRYGMGLVALRLGDTVQAHHASVALSRLSDRASAGDLGWSLSRSL
ncbi:MAG TPA: tetratricopeptide repeat protein, partial [Gemmatimonadales bacterium]|nr:tetratricopeptide repeat protein [Gemmatimonadales bacterium]